MAFNVQGAKQAGYSDQEITQYLASKQPAQPAQPQEKQGSILDGILPFVGGVGGSILGAPLGPAGVIGGGAAGSGLGEFIRQLIGGKGVDAGSIGKEAAIGGVGGVAGEALNPLLRGGLSLLTKGAAKGLDNAGEGFIASQYNVPRSIARTTKMGDTLTALNRYGINNINDVVPAADKVTGANGVISKAIRTAISGSAPVDTTGIADMAKAIAAHPSIPNGTDKKFLDFVNNGLSSVYGGTKGTLASEANPSDVFGLIQELESHAADLTKGKAPALVTSEDRALKNGYKQLADELKQRLFEGKRSDGTPTLGADRAIAEGVMTPEQLQTLASIHPQLAMDAQSAQTAGELRKIASHFVKGSQLANETEAGSQIGFNSVGGAAKGVGKLVQNPLNLLAVPLGSDTVNAGIGGAARSAAKKVAGIPTPPIAQILSAITGQGGAQASSVIPDKAQASEASVIPQPSSMQPGVGPAPSMMQPGVGPEASMMQPGANPTKQNSQNQVLRQVLGQIMFSKAKNVGDIKAAYDFMNPASNAKPLTDTQRRTQANAQSGLRALNNAESILKNDPNSPLKAKIPIVSGQSPYATATREIEDVLTRLRTGAALNKDEQKFYQDQLPQPFDSQATITYKLSIFRNLFNDLANGGTSSVSQ